MCESSAEPDEDAGDVRSFTTPMNLGHARVDLTKALALAAKMEDEEIVRKLRDSR
jgi:hypothetical protein